MRTESRPEPRTGQLSVRLAALGVSVALVFLLIGGSASADAPALPAAEYVVVQGDTLWAIASRHTEPGQDVRVTIERIMALSGIRSSGLVPGQTLLVPQA